MNDAPVTVAADPVVDLPAAAANTPQAGQAPAVLPQLPAVTDPIQDLKDKVAALEASLNKGSVFKRAYAKVNGLKTVVVGAVVGVVGPIADYFGGVDLHGVFGIKPMTAVVIGAVMVTLRALTNGRIGGR